MSKLLRDLRRMLGGGGSFVVWVLSMFLLFVLLTWPLLAYGQRHEGSLSSSLMKVLVILIFVLSLVGAVWPAGWFADRAWRGDKAAARAAKKLRTEGLSVVQHDAVGLAALVVRLDAVSPSALAVSKRELERRLEAFDEPCSIQFDDGAAFARFPATTPPQVVKDHVGILNALLADLPTAAEAEVVGGRLAIAPEADDAGRLAVADEAGGLSEAAEKA